MINPLDLASRCARDYLTRASLPYRPFPMKLGADAQHLRAAIEWLLCAIQHGEGGVAGHYSLLQGRWTRPFPETTGYIIPTLFDYAHYARDRSIANTAVQLADWLCDVQLDNGACMGGLYDRRKGKGKPIIFNTGQNIFGFLRAHNETADPKYLAHAILAGDFLVRSTDADGIWNQALHYNIPHTYNARVSWALLLLHNTTGNERYHTVAHSNLRWVLAQQQDNGWFRHANFKPGELPNTHGIAYTLRGLLESHVLSGREEYLHAARKTADRLLREFELRKYLFTFRDDQWKPHGKYFQNRTGRYICVTGLIQLAKLWMRFYDLTRDATYLNSAFKAIDFTKTLHDLDHKNQGIRGGIPGAFPLWGSYATMKFPNWATNFMAEALMMKMKRKSEWSQQIRRSPFAVAPP